MEVEVTSARTNTATRRSYSRHRVIARPDGSEIEITQKEVR
jgi:hypothetical protein